MRTIHVFLSWADGDKPKAEPLWDRLRCTLAATRPFQWELWSFDRQICVGDDFDSEIQTAIARSHLGLFAISPNFLRSSYIQTRELPPYLAPAARRRIAPIMLKALPKDANLLGLETRQIYRYHDPYASQRGSDASDSWVNGLSDELHRIARKYDLGG